MIYNERDTRKEMIREAAKQIMAAARTAPKGKGVDIIEIVTLTDDDLLSLASHMRKEGEKRGMMFFLRDAGNIEQADAVILIGTKRYAPIAAQKPVPRIRKRLPAPSPPSTWVSPSGRLVPKLPICVSTPGLCFRQEPRLKR